MNPYEEEKIDPRFVIKNEKTEWEDLEYAIENEDLGKKSQLPRSDAPVEVGKKRKLKTSRVPPLAIGAASEIG